MDSKWFNWRERKTQEQVAETKNKVTSELEKDKIGKKVNIDSVSLSDDEVDRNEAEQIPIEEVLKVSEHCSPTRTLPSRSCVSGGSRSAGEGCNCSCLTCSCSCNSSELKIPSLPIRLAEMS